MTPMYNIPLVLRFGEKLDPVVLDKALAAVIERHEVLRTRFITDEDGQLSYQQVLEPGGYALDVDVAQPQPVSVDGLSEAIADVVGVGFDLAAAPPLRARLLLDEDGSYVLVFIVHHVIGDGGSLAPLAATWWWRTRRLLRDTSPVGRRYRCSTPISHTGGRTCWATRPTRHRWPRASSGSGPTRWPTPPNSSPCPRISLGRRCRPSGPGRSASRSRLKPSLPSTRSRGAAMMLRCS